MLDKVPGTLTLLGPVFYCDPSTTSRGIHTLNMSERESDETVEEQVDLDSTLQSVDRAEAITMDAAKRLGFDEDEQHQIGMAVR